MTINRTICSAMVALAFSSQINASPLVTELSHLVSTHPLLKASENNKEATRLTTKSVKASLLPTIRLTGSVGNEDISTQSYLPDESFNMGNSGVGPEQYSDLNGNKFGVSLETSLYAGGRDVARIADANLNVQLKEAEHRGLTQDVLLEGITAYLQVARYLTLIELTKENENSTRNQLELERKRVEAGGGVEVDALQAKTRLQVVRERSVFYRQALRDVLANYEQVFGHAPKMDQLQALDIFEQEMPMTLPEALATSVRLSPNMTAAAIQTDKANESVNIAKSAYKPKIDFVINKSRDRNTNMLANRSDFFAGVKMTWEFNLGGESLYQKDSAIQSSLAQMQRAENIRNKTTESVRMSWNQVINGKERLELLVDASSIAKQVMQDRKKLRDAGKETALSVLDAEVEYYGVLANRINALYDTRINSYRLLSAIGKLNAESIGLNSGELRLPVQSLKVDLDQL